jgi:F0F1-type ATP synthase membrane subunit a
MFGQVHRELLPAGQYLAAELAGFVLWFGGRLVMTAPDHYPNVFVAISSLLSRCLSLLLRLWYLVLTDKVLQKVVFSIAFVLTIIHSASPPREAAMSLILVTNPISLPLE